MGETPAVTSALLPSAAGLRTADGERLHAVELAEARSGPVGLLRDLQDLHTTASLASTTWGVLRQAAKGCKDRELISVATRCESQNARQRSWLTTHIEQIAAQALLVAR